MGNKLSGYQKEGFDEDVTKGRNETVDSILEKLRDLHVVAPILKPSTGDSTLTDLLLRRTPSQSAAEALDPSTTANLFTLYQEWQRLTAANIAKNQIWVESIVNLAKEPELITSCHLRNISSLQASSSSSNMNLKEELGHKIIGVEELSVKLLQRLNYAGRVLESSVTHLKSVHALQVEVAEMKRSLTETIGSYEKLCDKVEEIGLQNIIRPVSISNQTQYGARAKTPAPPDVTSSDRD